MKRPSACLRRQAPLPFIVLLLIAGCGDQPPQRDPDASPREQAEAAFEQAERLRKTWETSAERQALELYAEALGEYERLGTSQDMAAALQGLGKTWMQLGDAQQSIEHLQRALALLEEHRDDQAAVLNDLGRAYDLLEETEKSFVLHQKALALSKSLGNPLQEGISLRNIALRHAYWGELEDSINTSEEAIEFLRGCGDEGELAEALRQVGRTYSLLGRMEESFDRFNEALAIREKQQKVRYQASILTEIGWNHHLQGDHAQAIKILQRAIELNRTGGHRIPPGILDRLGSSLRDADRLDEALEAYQQALQLMENEAEVFRASTLVNLAELHVKRGQPELALSYCEQTISLFERRRDTQTVAHIHYIAAQAERDRGKLAEAQARMEEALRILDLVRLKVYRQAFVDAYQTSNNLYYETQVDLLMRRHQEQPGRGFDVLALAASERTRARRLEEALTAGAPSHRPLDPALVQQRRRLLGEVEAKDRERFQMVESARPRQEIEALDKEQNRLLLELDRIQSELRPQRKKPAAPLDPVQIQECLAADTLLLYYALGKQRSFLWLVGSDFIESFTLAPGPKLESLARQSHRLFNEAQTPAVQLQADLYLRRLQESLLGPVLDKLGTRRLVLVPDASLQYIPFAALPVASGKPLIAGHEISFLPSATTLSLLKQRPVKVAPPENELALFADPVFNSRDARLGSGLADGEEPDELAADLADVQRSARDLGLLGFPRLRHTRKEGESILALFPQERRFGAFDFAANRKAFLDLDLSQYRILHFATHGLLHPHFPELSGIVLSLVDENGAPRAGFLRSQDIASLRLKADLVVLSACKTAMGKEIPGEGVIGLPQSFMQAGVPQVVVSLWSVSDPATSELMRRFYRHMVDEELSAPAALRATQLSMLDEAEWSHPYYWAGFVFLGSLDEK